MCVYAINYIFSDVTMLRSAAVLLSALVCWTSAQEGKSSDLSLIGNAIIGYTSRTYVCVWLSRLLKVSLKTGVASQTGVCVCVCVW